MRKIVAFLHMSLDGMVAAPDGGLDWVAYDNELAQFGSEVSNSAGATLYGRVTYQLMESYWPTVPANPNSTPGELRHAEWLENIHKVVVSTTLDEVTWNNTTLIQENVVEELTKLKEQPGKDIVIFGSPRLTHYLTQQDMVDEWRLTVSPVVVGEGTPLFNGVHDKIALKLLDSRTLASGVLILHYQTVR
jgi:dihydrofolate reductase